MELNREMAVTLRGRYRDDISPGIERTQQIVEQNMRQISAADSRARIVDSETANRWILAAQRTRLDNQKRLNLDYQNAVAKMHKLEFASVADKENLLLELRRTHIHQTQQLQQKASAAAVATAAGTVTAVAAAAAVALAVTRAAVYAVVATITGAVERAVAIGEETNRLAVQLNLTAEKLSALGYAAEQNESSIGSLAQSMRFLSVAMNEAAEGSKEQIELFRRMGVDFRNASTGGLRDPLAVFIDLARQMRGSQDQALLTAAAVKLFGRSADELLPLIRNIDAFEASMREAQAMGFIISADEARLADDFADSLGTISKMVDVLARSVAAELLPVLMELVQETKAWWLANHEAVSADVQLLFREVAALLREIGNIAKDSGASITDGFRLATSAGLLFVGMLSNAASGWYRLQQGAASARSLAAAFTGQFEAAGKFSTEARRAGEMAERLEQIAERSSKTAVDVMTGAAEKMFQRTKDAAELMSALPVAAHAPSRSPSPPAPPDEDAIRQNEQLNQIILAARRARMDEEERLLSEYQQAVTEIHRLEKADHQKKEEAIYEQTLLYNEKLRALLDRRAAEDSEFQEKAALGIQKNTERILSEAEKGADQFAQRMLDTVRQMNQNIERETQAAERRRQIAHRALLDEIAIAGETQRLAVELDFDLAPDAREQQLAYIDMLTEVRMLEAEFGGLSPEEQTAQRENYFNRMNLAAARYQATLKRLEREYGTMRQLTQVLTQAFRASFQAAILGQESFGVAMRKAVAEYIASQAALAAVGAIVETAHGFAALASHRYQDAAFHFQAAAFYATVAAVAGVAARALSGGGSSGGGTGGGETENYGPREYTSEDIARIRAQGRGDTATGAGESAADAQRPIVVNHFHNKILTPDVANTKRWFDKHQAIFTRGAAVEMARNPAVAKAIGQLATRER